MSQPFSSVALIGVGRAGTAMLAQARSAGVPAEACLAVHSRHAGELPTPETGVITFPATELDALDAARPAALGALVPGLAEALRRLCAGRQWVLLLTGLGGRTGSTVAPLLAAETQSLCPRVVAVVSLPGPEEGRERQHRARRALAELTSVTAGSLTLPHDQLGAADPNAPFTAAFDLPGQLLAGTARGLWRLLTAVPVLRLHAEEFCEHLRGFTCQTFAAVETSGPERATAAVARLLEHPLLARGAALAHSRVILGIIGGADLTRSQLGEIVQGIETAAEGVHVILNAATVPDMNDRLGLVLIARPDEAAGETGDDAVAEAAPPTRVLSGNEPPDAPPLGTRTQTHTDDDTRIETSVPASRRRPLRAQQVPLPLDAQPRGRFERKDPTMHNGENLDLPTYLRRGIPLN